MLALKTCCWQQFYIFKFIINRKPPSLLFSVIRPPSLKNSSPSHFALSWVISLYSGGLMTENRNSGVFLFYPGFKQIENYILEYCSLTLFTRKGNRSVEQNKNNAILKVFLAILGIKCIHEINLMTIEVIWNLVSLNLILRTYVYFWLWVTSKLCRPMKDENKAYITTWILSRDILRYVEACMLHVSL